MGSPPLLCMTGGPAGGMANALTPPAIAHGCYDDKSTGKKDLLLLAHLTSSHVSAYFCYRLCMMQAT